MSPRKRTRRKSLPTLVFYDRQGQRQVQVGVLQPDQLRAVLQSTWRNHLAAGWRHRVHK